MYKNNNKLLATGRVEKKQQQQHDNFPYEKKSMQTKENGQKKRMIISMADIYGLASYTLAINAQINRLTIPQVKRISKNLLENEAIFKPIRIAIQWYENDVEL